MRILNIRFRNLNSLAGEWEIDLTAPEYESSGIFAITGPTGAGKSTILDAICLALYGRTPRLKRVSKGGNDIMTRHTGDCMAEVTFRTSHGKFRCVWTQHCARRKAGGELQPPRHVLFDEGGAALASKLGDVAAMIETLTGMDYARFTQSTLLAQGSFASFLLAEADERADLLEQITGTSLYSDISRHVYGRCRDEQAMLSELNARLGQCRALTDEEEAELDERRGQLGAQLSALDTREADLLKALDIVHARQALERDRQQLDQEQEVLRAQAEAFAADRQRLADSRRALAFAGSCSALAALRTEQERDEAQADEARASLPALRENADACSRNAEAARLELGREKEALAALQLLLKDVRAADTELAARQRSLAAQERTCEEARTRCAQAEQARSAAEKACAELTRRHGEEQAWLRAHEGDAALTAQLPGLEEQYRHMEQRAEHMVSRQARIKTVLEGIGRNEERSAELHTSHERILSERADFVRQMEEKARERDALLEGRTPSDWRTEKEALERRQLLLGKAAELVRLRSAHLERCAALAQAQALEQRASEQEQQKLADLQSRHAALCARQEVLEETLALLEKVRGFEEERLHLRDGQPCPLCGSAHHPYALGNVPAPDEKREALLLCRKERAAADEARQTVLASLAARRRSMEHLDAQEQERRSEAEACRRELDTTLSALYPALNAVLTGKAARSGMTLDADESAVLAALTRDDAPALLAALTGTQTHCAEMLAHHAAVLHGLDVLEQGLAAMRSQLEHIDAEAVSTAGDLARLEQGLAVRRAELQHLRQEQDSELAMLEQALEETRLRLLAFGANALTLDDVREALQNLAMRRESHHRHLQNEAQLRADLAGAEQRLNACGENLTAARSASASAAEAVLVLRDGCRTMLEKRHALFGDDDADAREAEAQARVEAQEHKAEELIRQHDSAAKVAAEVETRLSTVDARLAERGPRIHALQAALHARLDAEGFSSEAQCLALCLPEDEQRALEQKAAVLDESAAALAARQRENERRLAETPDAPAAALDELEAAYSALKHERAAAQAERGALDQRLKDSAEEKRRSAELLHQKEAQEKICRRWDALSDLIGSADGKKYRTYAQGLTFRMLIRCANSQLAAMSDRYTLVQDPEAPLALCVIDRYQADIVRTSRNLSGGESFLVSLSLALGLARMASRTVSVDSVFLDEGFGTLDEEALNMALEMLSSLRQQGKTIGLISHVAAIRERLGVRIQVEPDGGGRSRLIGPGIRRLSN